MLVLVTGGAGFIGSHIVHELVRKKIRVRVIDNLVTGKKENISDVIDKIEFIKADICNEKELKYSLKNVDYVLHQAALRSVPKSIVNPIAYNNVNVHGTLLLLKLAKENKVKRVVYASSSSVYGNTPELPKKETQLPAPISPYAVSKLAGEYYCRMFTEIYGLETVCLRYFNVFGPKQALESQYAVVIPKFIISALKDEPLEIHGDGLQSRDFSYIENVVSANLLAMNSKNAAGKVFNIACNKRYTILDVANTIGKILNKKLKYIHTAPRIGDVRHTLADISQAKKYLGYKVIVGFEEGMKRTIEYMRNTI